MNDFREKIINLVDTSIEQQITRSCIICNESTGNQWDEVCPKCKQAVMFIREQIEEGKNY